MMLTLGTEISDLLMCLRQRHRTGRELVRSDTAILHLSTDIHPMHVLPPQRLAGTGPVPEKREMWHPQRHCGSSGIHPSFNHDDRLVDCS